MSVVYRVIYITKEKSPSERDHGGEENNVRIG